MIHDIRYAFRILAKSPSFTLVAVLTLALGITANSTIFTWISSTLLNPIPGVTHTSDLVTINRGERSDHPTPPFSYPDLRDLQERTRSFSGLLGYHDDYMSLTGGASRGQFVRQLLVASLMLSLAAGAVAILLTIWTARSLAAFFPPSTLPLSNSQHVDLRVLLATTAISILAALIFGVLYVPGGSARIEFARGRCGRPALQRL